MSEKVVLTNEQADAIERAVKRYGKDQFLYDYSKMLHEISPAQYTGNLDPINDLALHQLAKNDLALHQLAKGLYNGYEIEPSFDIGDWITDNLSLITGKIKLINQNCYKLDTNISVSKEMAKHSTRDAIKEEKRRRTEVKLDGILLSLTDTERIRMQNKLNCEDVSF